MDVRMTKLATKILSTLYKSYLADLKSGKEIHVAKFFGSSHTIQQKYFPKERHDLIDAACFELGKLGFLKINPADNIAYQNYLTTEAIVHMEYRFRDGVSGFFGAFSKIKSFFFPLA